MIRTLTRAAALANAAVLVAFLAIVLTATGDIDTAPITGLAIVLAILSLARP